MNIPTATYRLQFRNGMTFEHAAELVPRLKQLGISHLYASPVFTATSGSTHGYDITHASQIEPAIGGRAGFDQLVNKLKSAGLGLILDIVPNHMAASLENPWWRDVIEQGAKSRYARHFDIDWSRRLTLPFLGDTFARVLANGDISVQPDPQTGRPALVCYNSFYPLAAETWQGRAAEVLKLTDSAAIAALHDRQPWQLISWREAARNLSYRRFFEITSLAGVRVEEQAVFDDTHQLILELVHAGAVDGLRIDHIDGLADPKGYLERLRQQTGPECWIIVEKILCADEQLPADWPVSGTTGYEFIASLANVMVDDDQIGDLRRGYNTVAGKPAEMATELRSARLLMTDNNFAGEFSTLLRLAMGVASATGVTLEEEKVRSALRELLASFPVYRTYGTAAGLPAADKQLLEKVGEKVRNSANAPDPQALDFIIRTLTSGSRAALFRSRFQQLTGPLMAKSVEDTLFYRQNMALALNEVGGEPLPHPFSVARFHAEMQTRLKRQPDALSATTTHDTKRGEDARARLFTLTETPQRWAAQVDRWRQINHSAVIALDDGPAPEPAVEWMLYQALAGVWPTRLQPDDEAGLKALEVRFTDYVEKALREAKLRTDWGNSNERYEKAVLDYSRHLLTPANQSFLQDFSTALQPFIHAGLVNSLSQTVIKLTAPGVPDIYQGCELLDFSLVDPDNRREPDFAMPESQLNPQRVAVSAMEQQWLSGCLKQQVITRLLHLRRQRPALFRHGCYLPLSATGKRAQQVLAFARQDHTAALIVIVPRLVSATWYGNQASPHSAHRAATQIVLPAPLARRRYRDILSGEEWELTERIDLKSVNDCLPVILLSAGVTE